MSDKIKVESELSIADKDTVSFKRKPKSEPLKIHIYDTIGIFGQKGSGKTYLVKNSLIPNLRRLIVYDGEHDFPEKGITFNGKGKGQFKDWYMFNDFRKLVEFFMHASKKDKVNKKFKLIYRPRDNTSLAEWDFFCRIVYTFGNFFIVVDEFHNYLPSGIFKITRWTAQVLRLGRHKNIGFIGISQRPADVNTKFKGLISKAFIFRLLFSHDVKYVVDWFGKPMETVRKLYDYKFIYFDGEVLYLCNKVGEDEDNQMELDETPEGRQRIPKSKMVDENQKDQIIEIIEEVTEEY